jgi:hypothetical protein
MRTLTGIIAVLSIILSADGASARTPGSQKVVMTRRAAHHFIYFNTLLSGLGKTVERRSSTRDTRKCCGSDSLFFGGSTRSSGRLATRWVRTRQVLRLFAYSARTPGWVRRVQVTRRTHVFVAEANPDTSDFNTEVTRHYPNRSDPCRSISWRGIPIPP